MSQSQSQGSEEHVTRTKLCGVQGCCPTVEVHHGSNKVVIIDDEGGKITLTKEQCKDLAKVELGS